MRKLARALGVVTNPIFHSALAPKFHTVNSRAAFQIGWEGDENEAVSSGTIFLEFGACSNLSFLVDIHQSGAKHIVAIQERITDISQGLIGLPFTGIA